MASREGYIFAVMDRKHLLSSGRSSPFLAIGTNGRFGFEERRTPNSESIIGIQMIRPNRKSN
jgi:hypothetical protein